MNLSMVVIVVVIIITTIYLTKMPSVEYALNTTVVLKRLQYIVSCQKRMCS